MLMLLLCGLSLGLSIPDSERPLFNPASVDCGSWLQLPEASMDPIISSCRDLELSTHQAPEWGFSLLWRESEGQSRLSLMESVYLDEESLRPVATLTVDAADALFYSLLTHSLSDEELWISQEGDGGLDRLAAASFSGVPEPFRREAFQDALAAFGAHVLTLLSQIDRAFLRAIDENRNLCDRVDDVPLFRLWEHAFEYGRFFGTYTGDVDGTSRRRSSGGVLQPAAKRWMIREMLGADFRGSVDEDLAPHYCASAGDGVVRTGASEAIDG